MFVGIPINLNLTYQNQGKNMKKFLFYNILWNFKNESASEITKHHF